MLAAAALVPETALLVPGVSGAYDVLTELRTAVLAAVTDLVDARPDRVVVVAPRRPGASDGVVHRTGPLHPTLAAAGVDDARLGWTVPVRSGSVAVQDVAPAVGLHLLARVGWAGATEVVVVPPDARVAGRVGADVAQGVGADVAGGRTALLLLGSLSARRGPDGPLPDDDRAPEVDERVLADLTALGGTEASAARRRLTDLPAASADELAISAWAPWQVLCAAMDDDRLWRSTRYWTGAPFGATYAVLSWEPG